METIELFRGPYDFLSNFYEALVSYEGLAFRSAEAAFQAAKTLDLRERMRIAKLPPNEAKRAGRHVLLREDWEQTKDGVMHDVVYSKFRQNPELAKKLIQTGDAQLVEGNTWHDNYWGRCVCPRCQNKPGLNKLGKTLMMVREELKK